MDIALLGFGNVGRALARLLLVKQETLKKEFDLEINVVGVCTGRHGKALNPDGIDLQAALDAIENGKDLSTFHVGEPLNDPLAFLAKCPAELIFETTPTNPEDGQPALAYVFGALERGIHVVTANKGPVAFGYQELSSMADRKGVGFFFESSVMDGAPVLGVGREGLPAVEIKRIRGIFNSTTNYILTRMESDQLDFDAALKAAQEIGIAETDPTLDIDGWDSAIKTVILANVLMGADLRPKDVNPRGIRDLKLSDVQQAEKDGQRIRLLCEAERQPDGSITVKVAPERVPINDTLAGIRGTTSIVDFETDVLPKLTLIENDPGPDTTAYGLMVDMINIARGRHHTGRS